MLVIVNCSIATRTRVLHYRWLAIEEGRIEATGRMVRGAPEADEYLDARGGVIVPGYVDLHIHGCAGYDLCDGTEESIRGASRELAKRGVVGFLVTAASLPHDRIVDVLRATRGVMDHPEQNGARVLGVHLEGPYISPKCAGAQNLEHVRPVDLNEAREWMSLDSDLVRIMTFAPELPGAIDLVKVLSRRDVVPAMGHTNATYEETMAAIDAGAWYSTHTFNAMRPLHHRDPGPIAAVLTHPRVHCEIIADGIHVHPGVVRMLMHAKGPDKTVIVSDNIVAAGLPDGEYEFTGRKVTVLDGAARLESGALAGSVKTLDRAVDLATGPRDDDLPGFVRAMSTTPARVLGMAERCGEVEPGLRADLVFLDYDLRVMATMIGGRAVYRR